MIVISAIYNEKKNAGPKAPEDIDRILGNKYNAKSIVLVRDKFFKIKICFQMLKLIFKRDIIVIQFPLINLPIIYNLLNKKRVIVLIHDINGLRFDNKSILLKEIKILKKFKYVIAHNKSMKEYLIKKGLKDENIYTIDVFDYLATGNINDNEKDKNTRKVLYTGNLNKNKSPFIYQLDDNKINFDMNLYGIGIEKDISKKIKYKGSFEPNEINDIEGSLGLVWDGDIESFEQNNIYKSYTKYNNPHKFSCYLAMGIPIIAWKNAAISDFIKKNNVGYLIDNIYDINNIDLSDYNEKRKNAIKIGRKLRGGKYTLDVFDKIVKKIVGDR